MPTLVRSEDSPPGRLRLLWLPTGVSQDRLRAIVGGKSLPDAFMAALDALESGALALDL